MRRTLKILAWFLGSLFLVLAIGVVWIISLDLNSRRHEIANQLSTLTGWQIRITDGLHYRWTAPSTLQLEGVVVDALGYAVAAEKATVDVALLPLLTGQVRVNQLHLDGVEVTQGTAAPPQEATAPAAETQAGSEPDWLRSIVVEESSLELDMLTLTVDGRAIDGLGIALTIDNLRWQGGAATVDSVQLTVAQFLAEGLAEATPLQLEITDLEWPLQPVSLLPTTATLKLTGDKLVITGQEINQVAVDARLSNQAIIIDNIALDGTHIHLPDLAANQPTKESSSAVDAEAAQDDPKAMDGLPEDLLLQLKQITFNNVSAEGHYAGLALGILSAKGKISEIEANLSDLASTSLTAQLTVDGLVFGPTGIDQLQVQTNLNGNRLVIEQLLLNKPNLVLGPILDAIAEAATGSDSASSQEPTAPSAGTENGKSPAPIISEIALQQLQIKGMTLSHALTGGSIRLMHGDLEARSLVYQDNRLQLDSLTGDYRDLHLPGELRFDQLTIEVTELDWDTRETALPARVKLQIFSNLFHLEPHELGPLAINAQLKDETLTVQSFKLAGGEVIIEPSGLRQIRQTTTATSSQGVENQEEAEDKGITLPFDIVITDAQIGPLLVNGSFQGKRTHVESGRIGIEQLHLSRQAEPLQIKSLELQLVDFLLGENSMQSVRLNGHLLDKQLVLNQIDVNELEVVQRPKSGKGSKPVSAARKPVSAARPAPSSNSRPSTDLALSWLESILIARLSITDVDFHQVGLSEYTTLDNLNLLINNIEIPLKDVRLTSLDGTWEAYRVRIPPRDFFAPTGDLYAGAGKVAVTLDNGRYFGAILAGKAELDLNQPAMPLRLDFSGNGARVKLMLDHLGEFPFVPSGYLDARVSGEADLIGEEPLLERIELALTVDSRLLAFSNLSLDTLIDAYKSFDQVGQFSLKDAGVFLVLGPIGILAQQGRLITQSLKGLEGLEEGSTNIRDSRLQAKLQGGRVLLNDFALATDKNRIAVRGLLDLNQQNMENLILAILNPRGCAFVQVNMQGSFSEPDMAMNALDPEEDCTPFYPGPVRHPNVEE